MPRSDLKISKDGELGGEALRAIAQKYVKWMSYKPGIDLPSLADEPLPASYFGNDKKNKEAYEQAAARVPRSQLAQLKEMQDALLETRIKSVRGRGGAGRSGMSPTRGDM